jgi:protein SCO1
MSAELHSSQGQDARGATNRTGNSRRNVLRWLFVINGLVCCILIGVLIAFGSRGHRPTGSSGRDDAVVIDKEPLMPLAKATDAIEDDDDNGKPKVIKIEARWSEDGIDDFEFTERSGRTIRKADLLGRPWVVSFIFTNCAGPCYKVTSAMRELQDEFLKDTDLRLVTFSVDPERDTPEVLTKYANGFKADTDKWLFLTGDKAKIYNLINGSFLMPVMEADGEDRKPGFEIIHTTNILLVDDKGVVQGKWSSTDEAQFDQLRRLLRKRLRRSDAESKDEETP